MARENQVPPDDGVEGGDSLSDEGRAAADGAGRPQALAGADEGGEPEEEGGEGPGAWKPDPAKLLQALLFASPEFLSARTLRDAMGEEWDLPALRQLVKAVNRSWQVQDAPFELIEVDGTFRCRTLPRYHPWIKKLFREAGSVSRRLSQASLETLAIIAYKQPITKAEVEAIRGVNVDGTLKSLLDKRLIDIAGKSEAVGASYTYRTTKDFLRYFGISKVPDDLPRLQEFEDLIQSQALIPQVDREGNIQALEQGEGAPPDGEQLEMGMGETGASGWHPEPAAPGESAESRNALEEPPPGDGEPAGEAGDDGGSPGSAGEPERPDEDWDGP